MSDNIRDASTQTIGLDTKPPHIYLTDTDHGGATRGPNAERPRRKERRRQWYAPIREKIRRNKEKKSNVHPMTSDTVATPFGSSRVFGSYGGIESYATQQLVGGQSIYTSKYVQGPGAFGSLSQDPRNPATGPFAGHPGYQAVHAQAPRSPLPVPPPFFRQPQYHPSQSRYPPSDSFDRHRFQCAQTQTQNYGPCQSGQRNEPHVPEILISPAECLPVHQEGRTRVSPSVLPRLNTTDSDLLGLHPVTPSVNEMKELPPEEIGLMEISDEPVAMPDPSSSNSATRTSSSDWDEATKVPPGAYNGLVNAEDVLLKDGDILEDEDNHRGRRMELVRDLVNAGELHLARGIRSQTWTPSASDPHEAWLDCDSTVCEEHYALQSKDDTSSIHEMPVVFSKVVENAIAHSSGSWVGLV